MVNVIFPIPSVPLVDERGRITASWYRMFVSLMQRTGGVEETPVATEPFSMGLFDFSPQREEDARQGFLALAMPEGVKENSATTLLFSDGGEKETSTTLLDLQTPAQDQPVSLVLQELPWPAAPEGIVVGASPFSFSPGFDGFTTITGGTVSAITLSRDGGATIFSTGLLLGVFPLSLSDTPHHHLLCRPNSNLLP